MSPRDEEEQLSKLLAPTPEYLASVKVFPLIPNLKKDVMVRRPVFQLSSYLTRTVRPILVCPLNAQLALC